MLIVVKYCFVATDGIRCMVIDALETEVAINKSRVWISQQTEILNKTNDQEPWRFDLKGRKADKRETKQILVRKEKEKKRELTKVMNGIFEKGNRNEIIYWYGELKKENICDFSEYTLDGVIELFRKELGNWSESHNNLLSEITSKRVSMGSNSV
ncbi:DUF3603 family protein [Guptibacillus spartinae]|uniref:DUF3603 family protein n=1 Tax=Guptibacillus spartinae TaxID=3025679 RepID=UPI002361013B|nr:DUF3603 family protein [Pseudalkalibacillus spartinae]